MSSNFQAINEAIRKKFDDKITDQLTIKTQFPNQKFTQPVDEIWAKLNILWGESQQTSVGSPSDNNFRNTGTMLAQLFLPFEKGDKELLELADSISDEFTSVTVEGVTYRTPSIVNVGRSGKWWQVNVAVPWQSERRG